MSTVAGDVRGPVSVLVHRTPTTVPDVAPLEAALPVGGSENNVEPGQAKLAQVWLPCTGPYKIHERWGCRAPQATGARRGRIRGAGGAASTSIL